MFKSRHGPRFLIPAIALTGLLLCVHSVTAQQPIEPTNPNPIPGETYYVINQLTGDQMDLNASSKTAGSNTVQSTRSFTSTTQRWGLTRLTDNNWKFSNLFSGLCLDAVVTSGVTYAVEEPCTVKATQEWTVAQTTNGYSTIKNVADGYVLDIFNGSTSAGAYLSLSTLGSTATQSQQWLLRPSFFRGIDNALLEKEEAEKVAKALPWWKDDGTPQDVLQMLKNHGVNMVRIRPSSQPPYATQTATSCNENLCYAETEAQDLDLARRAKKLGMSVELTLLFDGGSSYSVPAVWAGQTDAQLATSVYNYVKAEIEMYRSAGVLPDMVAVGNEVDTGFLGYYPSSQTYSNANFAAIEKQGLQAVRDAAADTGIGAAVPAPLTCIHVTPNYNSNLAFYQTQASSGVVFDAVCQSYYPFYHGPLTQAQAAAANPNHQAVEQATLTSLATTLGKPIFIIETAEHFEPNGFGAADPWYPETTAGQRQFLIDLDDVLKGLPGNLAMGMEYWGATAVNIPEDDYNSFQCGDGYTNGDNAPDATYVWNSVTLYDNADVSSYCSNPSAQSYSALLPAADALGGKFDSALTYKLVNRATAGVLESYQASTASGAVLDVTADRGSQSLTQQWSIASNGVGFFTITNAAMPASGPANVLDDPGASTAQGTRLQQLSISGSGSPEQLWDVQTAGNGDYTIVNHASGQVLDLNSSGYAVQNAATGATSQQWQIVPVRITSGSLATQLAFSPALASPQTNDETIGTIKVAVEDTSGALVGNAYSTVTLTITGPGTSITQTATPSGGVATFTVAQSWLLTGSFTVTATANGLTSATQAVIVNALVGLQLSSWGKHDFGAVADGQVAQYGIQVTNSSSGTLPFAVQLQGSSDFAQSNTCGSSIAAGATCEITFTYAPPAGDRAYESAAYTIVTTKGTAVSGGGTAPLLANAVNSAPTIVLSTTQYSFGAVSEGATASGFGLVVRNASGVTVNFSAVTSQAGNAPFALTTTCTGTLAAGATCTVSGTFTPTTRQYVSDTITFSAAGGATFSPGNVVTVLGYGQ